MVNGRLPVQLGWIPVINASKNNPCICFNFSYTPKNINEYIKTVTKLQSNIESFNSKMEEIQKDNINSDLENLSGGEEGDAKSR